MLWQPRIGVEDRLTSLVETPVLETAANHWQAKDPLYNLVMAIERERDRRPSFLEIMTTPVQGEAGGR